MLAVFIKNLKILGIILFSVLVAPFLLIKLGVWSPTFAQSDKAVAFLPAFPASPAPQQAVSYATAVERAAPAVVSIHPTQHISQDMNPLLRDPFFRQFFGDLNGPTDTPQGGILPSLGSGVIVSKEGYILTNHHVIAGADEIKIKLNDGQITEAKVVGTDPESDIAVLKIELKNIPVIALGNSETLRVGDVVLAIGNPFGVGQTVTQGIVSATHRSELGINTFENFIQTDAAINPGNSGGALIDVYGNLIGINNAIYTRSGGHQGIGFAIPIFLAQEVMAELIQNGQVTRGWLGITVRPLTDDTRKSLNYPTGKGTIIAGVVRGGPAHKAGLQPGDIIISINNQKTDDPTAVLNISTKLPPEKAFPITVIRNGETLDFRIIAGLRPVTKSANPAAALKPKPAQGRQQQ